MKKILLIEDNNELRENTAEILEMAGYKVITSRNGKEGVASALSEKPDLIVCDIMMPELDGYGVLHMLAKNPETSAIPFIFLTAKTERGDFRKGMEMGADDYLTKPFDDTELLNAIEIRLRKLEMLQKDYPSSIKGFNEFLNGVKGLEKLKRLAEERDVRKVKKKETIYQEGNYPRGVFLTIKGQVKTYKTNDLGKDLITGIYKPGDFFGFLSLLQNIQYTDSAIAMEDSEVCMILKEDFEMLIYNNAEVSKKFMKILSNNLHEKEEELLRIAYNSVRKRIADALVRLHGNDKTNNQIRISRDDLAAVVGTAYETIIRTLADFKQEKLIDMKGSEITILHPEKLSRLPN
jgi:CRP-like cAMP-binding protein/DNA-binding NarL/FixJ family response regulator